MTKSQAICPLCFVLFPAAKSGRMCPHCESEAIEVEIVPLSAFLADNSLADLEALLSRWEQATGFLPEYQKEKAARIAAIIRRKKQLAG